MNTFTEENLRTRIHVIVVDSFNTMLHTDTATEQIMDVFKTYQSHLLSEGNRQKFIIDIEEDSHLVASKRAFNEAITAYQAIIRDSEK